MKLLLLLALTFTLTACGKKKEKPPISNPGNPDSGAYAPTGGTGAANTAFASYAQTFETRINQAGYSYTLPSNLRIVFSTTLGQNVLGTCTMGQAYVKINQSWWAQLPNADREELIFHELGHCLLNRLHNTALRGGGLPDSIMYPYHLGPAIYTATSSDYQHYMSELFLVPTVTFAGLTWANAATNYASQIQASLMMDPLNPDHYSQEDDSHIDNCYHYAE